MAAPLGLVRVRPLRTRACLLLEYSFREPLDELPESSYFTFSVVPVLSTVTSAPLTETMPLASPLTVALEELHTMDIVRSKLVLEISSSSFANESVSVEGVVEDMLPELMMLSLEQPATAIVMPSKNTQTFFIALGF